FAALELGLGLVQALLGTRVLLAELRHQLTAIGEHVLRVVPRERRAVELERRRGFEQRETPIATRLEIGVLFGPRRQLGVARRSTTQGFQALRQGFARRGHALELLLRALGLPQLGLELRQRLALQPPLERPRFRQQRAEVLRSRARRRDPRPRLRGTPPRLLLFFEQRLELRPRFLERLAGRTRQPRRQARIQRLERRQHLAHAVQLRVDRFHHRRELLRLLAQLAHATLSRLPTQARLLGDPRDAEAQGALDHDDLARRRHLRRPQRAARVDVGRDDPRFVHRRALLLD